MSALINGQAYNFIDMSLSIGGITTIPGFTGLPIKGITYNTSRVKSANYENSRRATSYSYGIETVTGTLTLTADTAFYLKDAIFALGVTDRNLVSMPVVDITLSYINKGKSNVVVIKNVAFTTDNNGGSQGDDQMTTTADFIATEVKAGGVLATALTIASYVIDNDNQGLA